MRGARINRQKEQALPFEEARRLFDYDQESGHLYWRVVRGRGIGKRAGHERKRDRNVAVKVGPYLYLAHRLIWLWMVGSWPEHVIDHKDGNAGNNSWANLRAATSRQNSMNMRGKRGSSAGLKGCYAVQLKKGIVYRAQIEINGRRIYLGTYATPELANAAYKRAADQFFGVFARA